MRVVPKGFSTSTWVVTSKVRQSSAAVRRANGRHFLFPRGNARAAETAAVEERKSRRFMVPRSCPSWDRTRTLLIQSQACCQLHQGAGAWKIAAYALVAKCSLNISPKLSGL